MSAETETSTVQQLDPLGTLDGRPISVVTAIVALAAGLIMTWMNADLIAQPVLAGAALLTIAVASATVLIATGPLRAPFSAGMHALVIGLMVFAYALSSASLSTAGGLAAAYWGPLVIGAMCMVLAPYRPVAELVAVGVVASVLTASIALAQSSVSSVELSPIIAVLASITPVLTMSLGGAAFAGSLAQTHVRWETRARRFASRQLERQHESVARSVQQDRVTILNRDVVPLFVELTKRGIISPEDRARAAEYSESIRDLMVTEVNRSWLESVVASSYGGLDDGKRVQDPHRLAGAMTAHQRTALRAAVIAVAHGDELVRESVRLVIEKTSSGALIIVHATVATSESSWRSSLSPYFAVLRVVFTDLQITFHSPALTVRFTYDTP